MFSAGVPECFRSRARVSNILTKSCLRDSYFSLSIANRVSENAVLSWIFIISSGAVDPLCHQLAVKPAQGEF